MKTNLLLFIDSSKLFWYLFWGDLKNSSIKSSALSLTIISMLSLFECVRHSSSLPLEELKLFAIVHVNFPRIRFWRLFTMSFNMVWFYNILFYYKVLFLSSFLIFSINITPKITNSSWFVIIFFFMLKKISNIFSYFSINYVILFFSLKGFFIPLILASFNSFFSFFNLKRFLTSLIFLSSLLLYSLVLQLFHHYMLWKYIFRKNRTVSYFFKSVLRFENFNFKQ